MKFIEALKQNNKGSKNIKLPMSEALITFLQSLKPKEKGYVFVNPKTNKPYADIKRVFKTSLKRAGILDFYFHDLRRTFGTWLLQNGVDIRTIQTLLAH